MVDAAAALPAEAEVQGRDPDVLQERGVVRAGSERSDAQVGPLPRLLTEVGRAGVGDGAELGAFPGAEPGLGVVDVPRDVVDKRLARVRAEIGRASCRERGEMRGVSVSAEIDD